MAYNGGMEQKDTQKPLLSTSEAAKILGLPEQRLRDWAKSRKSPLRVQLVMGRLFWQSSDVQAMAEGRL